jgi:hypothetical protein
MFATMTGTGQFTGSFKAFKKFLRMHRGRLVQGVMDKYPDVAASFRKESVDVVSRDYGLLCLSAVRDNILMWSHYGRRHTGVVIGLKTGHAFLNSTEPLVKVEYREERVEMGYLAAPRSRELQEQIESLIRRKSPQWSYEREWRQLRFLRHCKTEEDPGSPGQVHHFIAIEPGLIREVIVGCRATETLISEVGKIKRLSHFAHVQFLQARMHETDFALEFGPF